MRFKLKPKIVIRISDNSRWVFIHRYGELDERILMPNHYAFAPLITTGLWGLVAITGDTRPMDIDEFKAPDQSKEM